MSKNVIIAVAAAALLLGAAPVSAAIYTGTGSGPDGSVAGTADITLGTGSLTVKLTDNTINPGSIGQSLSDVEIVFQHAGPGEFNESKWPASYTQCRWYDYE